MSDALLKDISKSLNDLQNKIEKLENAVADVAKELGVRTGKQLSEQIDSMQRDITQIKSEVAETKVDTTNLRRVQEYGSKETQEIKRALAAIYKNTDEIEKQMLEERETYA